MITLAKIIGGPGSMGFFLLCGAVAASIGFAAPRRRRTALCAMALLAGLYVIGATDVVAAALLTALPGYSSTRVDTLPPAPEMLVILSGDNPRGRARLTRDVLNATKPRCVIVSGSARFVRELRRAGVPLDSLILDDTAETTREQILKVPEWARSCGASQVVLIASSLSMPRIHAMTRSSAVPIVLLPSPLDHTVAPAFPYGWLPSRGALRVARDAIYERAALIYYERNGWLQ